MPKHVQKSKTERFTAARRPQIGSHLDRRLKLNPRRPAFQEPGEKRGTGKGAIKLLILNTIFYRLSATTDRKLVHHEESLLTLKGATAETCIREWLGLNDDDYCEILKVAHTFVPDVPKLKVEADSTQEFKH